MTLILTFLTLYPSTITQMTDLSNILHTSDDQSKQNDMQDKQQSETALTPVTISDDPLPTVQYENPPVPHPNSNVQVTNNSTQMQNFLIIPRMIFPHSNVNINYNFSK